jgi:biopolymer transport protein ExbB
MLSKLNSKLAAIVIPLSLIGGYLIYNYILGNPSNFEGGVITNQPLKGNYLGVIHKGGPIVILLITFQIVLVTFSVERLIALKLATGKNESEKLIESVKTLLLNQDFEAIKENCVNHKGPVANVLYLGTDAYEKIAAKLDPKFAAKILQNELENYAQLEVPTLQKNMPIISTIAQVATLVGLLGTVTGMIIAFSAMARVGAPDAVGLASGISQALVTTALGISTSAVAIIMFNYLNSRIETVVYQIDEAIFTLVQSKQIKA